MEIWKDIPGYEGLYQASDLGRIKRLKRIDSLGRTWPEKILSRKPMSNGYCIISLKKPSEKAIAFCYHRIIALAFFGPSDLEVDHIDGNPSNNRLSNLEYVTHMENQRRAFSRKGNIAGVNYHKRDKTWNSRIQIKGIDYSLGTFKNFDDAVSCRRKAEDELKNTGDVSFKINKKKKNPYPVGVCFCKQTKKFKSLTYKNSKVICHGYFSTIEDALESRRV